MFTTYSPHRHRTFTRTEGATNRLPGSLSDRSSRSYYGGASATERIAGDANPERAPALFFGHLEIRPDELQALVDGLRVGLTVREFQVLLVLAQREDHVVRRTDIYAQVWGGEMKKRDRSVDVFVRKVRNKLARATPDWTYIHTHFGVGYRFAAIPLGEERTAEVVGEALAPALLSKQAGLAG
jgi:DNA-binding response OmpR family regulator